MELETQITDERATPQTKTNPLPENPVTTAGWNLETFQPTGHRMAVWLDPGEQVTPGGLILPPDAQEIRSTGIIVAVSPAIQAAFHPGQRVLVSNVGGLSLGWLKNTPVNLYEIDDIQAVLEEDDA